MTKIALIGCGGIMGEHAAHLKGMREARVVGCCDVDLPRAKVLADSFKCAAFSNVTEMLDTCQPHAVYIGVPPDAHGDMEEAAAERGIHFFVEGPIASNAVTAKRIAAAVRKAKTITSVGYCFRYYDTVALARQMLKGKAVSLIHGHFSVNPPEAGWRRSMEESGGQIVGQTSHLFDLLRYLCGDIAEVYAVAARGCHSRIADYDIDDSSVVSLRMKSGASACITSTCVQDRGSQHDLHIITPEGTYALRRGRLVVKESGKTTVYRPAVNIYAEENQAFIEAVRSGRRNRVRSTYSDALKTFLATCAANDSIRSGMPVHL